MTLTREYRYISCITQNKLKTTTTSQNIIIKDASLRQVPNIITYSDSRRQKLCKQKSVTDNNDSGRNFLNKSFNFNIIAFQYYD